jgi:D-amino-acid oxidase
VLGGTDVRGDASLEPSPQESDAIVERCARLVPALRTAERAGVAVGLRPGRAEVRLEAERLDGGVVVHDYGHGGSGVTLSWGCADEVSALALRAGDA